MPEPLASEAVTSEPVYYADAAYDGHRVYIHTQQDQALPPFAQDLFVELSGTSGSRTSAIVLF